MKCKMHFKKTLSIFLAFVLCVSIFMQGPLIVAAEESLTSEETVSLESSTLDSNDSIGVEDNQMKEDASEAEVTPDEGAAEKEDTTEENTLEARPAEDKDQGGAMPEEIPDGTEDQEDEDDKTGENPDGTEDQEDEDDKAGENPDGTEDQEDEDDKAGENPDGMGNQEGDDNEPDETEDTDGLSWEIEETMLLISGTGKMMDYGSSDEDSRIPDWMPLITDNQICVRIMDGVSSIGKGAFTDCRNLISVEIPLSVTSIGDYAFSGCGNLIDVYYEGSESEWNSINIGEGNEAFTEANIHYDGGNSDISLQSVSSDSASVDAGSPADFIFIIDSTGSMGRYINSVRTNLFSCMEYLEEKKVDINYAVIDFKDITADGADSTTIHLMEGNAWSADKEQVLGQLNSIRPDGGGDTNETPTDAFYKILGGEIKWRDDSQKFIFLLTDAGFKDLDPSMEQYVNYFRRSNVHVTVVGNTSYKKDYESLYTLTGGKFININSSNYYELMIDVADWVYDTLADMDGDGIPDDWEINGVDLDGDGRVDLHLEQMGCDPNVKDIFVEVDWMYRPREEGKFLGFISYTKQEEKNLNPSEAAMRMVYQQFKAHGINLHIDAGPDSVDFVTGRRWGSLSGGNSITYSDIIDLSHSYADWNRMALDNFSKERWSVFHYCLFVNRYKDSKGRTTSSGIAENIPGQFFIVADVDGWISGTNTATAATFMHELGHTLGLMHGGNEITNYKPNYLSIMNYLFQPSGLVGTNAVNYSDYVLPALDENNLNENEGIDPYGVTSGTGLGTKWYYDKNFLWFSYSKEASADGIAGQSIDFNQNGRIESNVSVNLNNEEETNLSESVNDWERLIFKGGLIGGQGEDISDETVLIWKDPSVADELDELDYDTALETGLMGNPGSCSIESINPYRIYQDIDDQKLYISINNFYTDTSTPVLTVSSNILNEAYTEELEIPGKAGEVQNVIVEIPVRSDLPVGIYSVSCELVCENGTVETAEEDILVLEAARLELTVGESINILSGEIAAADYAWTSSDDCVDVDAYGNVTANKEGTAVITGITGENDKVICIIAAHTENSPSDDNKPENKPEENNPDNNKPGENEPSGNDSTDKPENVPGENKPDTDKPGNVPDEDVPENNPDSDSGNQTGSDSQNSQNSSTASSSQSADAKVIVETWKPTTPDEKKRYACVGKETVHYTLSKDNLYRVVIENAVQGPMCFKSFESVLGDYTIGRTYNIYTLPNKTYSIDQEIQFTMKIPSAIYKKDREYKMICVTKNGEPIIYDDTDNDPETITVKTNKFYAYALIYK